MSSPTDQATSSRILRLRLRAHFGDGVPEPPPWPESALRVIRYIDREDCEVRGLARVIRGEAEVADQVLRLARTAWYMTREPVASVEQAIRVLGLRAIREMTTITASKRSVFEARLRERRVAELFRQSLGAGFLAREIAIAHGWDEHEAFLGALFHRAGAALTLAHMARLGAGLQPPTQALVAELLAAYEAPMSQALARAWALPEGVRLSLAHWADDVGAERVPHAALVTQLARAVALRLESRADFATMRQGLDAEPALVRLNVFPDVVEDLLLRREEFAQIVEAAS
ncbi:MAG: HDOD domain-containing protein [Deltaproteobacteria bacterium]|nr:HDOD domain-containing protein [Deltaproteobacteria bacterium]